MIVSWWYIYFFFNKKNQKKQKCLACLQSIFRGCFDSNARMTTKMSIPATDMNFLVVPQFIPKTPVCYHSLQCSCRVLVGLSILCSKIDFRQSRSPRLQNNLHELQKSPLKIKTKGAILSTRI